MPLNLTRSILVILVPGVIALSPWLLLLVDKYEHIWELYVKLPLPFNAVVFAIIVVFGSTVEGLMSYLEKRWDKQASEGPKPEPDNDWLNIDWYDYLAYKRGDCEPVAYRYISRKVTELYFEMVMVVASPLSIAGVLVLAYFHGLNACAAIIGAIAMGLLLTVAFYKFARDTHCVLYEVRHAIMVRLSTGSTAQKPA